MYKKNLLIFVLLFNINLFSADYHDDAAKVDFYVPGILANDGISQVNFLLCFLTNTNFGTFTNAGPYKALIDEPSCEKADGTDAVAEQQAATGGSAATSTDTAVTTVEEVTYSPGILNVTSNADGVITGNGWFDIEIEMGPATYAASKVYVQTVLTADKNEAAGRPYGNFTMTYEIKTSEAVDMGGGQTLASGLTILQGYLKIEGTSIKYYENGPFFTPRSIMGDVSNSKRDGFMLSNIKKYSGNGGSTVDYYQARYKLFQDELSGVYCQNFDSAVKYNQTANGLVASNTTYADSAAFEAEIADALSQNPSAQLETEGGSVGSITGEHCWSTLKEDATRQVYEYGTYLDSTGAKYDLANTSLTLEANSTDNSALTKSIHAHASYYGTHVNDSDKSNVTDSTVFKNQRNSSDTDTYNLRKNYYQIFQKSSSTKALNQLAGVSFQWYLGHFKTHPTWSDQLGSNGLNWPTSGSCNAAQGNCPEYSGTISVSGSSVTFTATHGMDWSSGIKPFALDTALTFTSAQWTQYMTNGSGWNENMHFHNPDSREQYRVPYAAFQNESNALVKVTTEAKVDISALEGKTFLCIERCLGASNLNDAISEAFSKVDTEAAAATLNKTPYVDKGPYFKVDSYYDSNGNGDQDGSENTEGAGRYNNIGGVVEADLSSYTVTNGILVGASADGGNIAWSSTNAGKLNSESYRNGIRKYSYKTKNPSYNEDNWTNRYGHSFRMNAVENTNKSNIKCEVESGNSRGYTDRYRAVAGDASLLVTGDSYYCAEKIRDGSVTSYTFELTKRPDYRVYNVTDAQITSISAPKSYEYTVPASGITYNFANTNLAGKKYTLKFEGFGELHNFPGRVFNTCTGVEIGRYVDSWNQCYRFIPEFTLPDGAVLTDKTGSDHIKVRALRGDEYLKKFSSLPTTRVYTKTFNDLPTANDLVAVSTVIGSVPTTGILNNGKASVIQGETVATPSQ